jgi:hypothetical protein
MASTDCQSSNCVMGVCQPAAMSGLKIQYSCLDPGQPNDSFIQPALKIVNGGSTNVPYSELKIRYYFTFDSVSTMLFQCAGAAGPGGNTFVHGTFVTISRPGADRYVEIDFHDSTATLNAGTDSGLIQTDVSGSSNFTETGDYSYDSTKAWPTFSDHTKITLWRNGTLIWGTEP